MKRTLAIIIAGALCAFGIGIGAAASGVIKSIRAELRPDFRIEIDGEPRTFKNADGDVVYPILYEGTTYLPLRAVGELMGKTVYWFEDEKRIELREEKTTVTDADVIVTDSKDVEKPPKDNKDKEPSKDDKDKDVKDKDVKDKEPPKDVKDKDVKDKDVKDKDVKDKPTRPSPDVSEFIGEENAKKAALSRAGLDADDVVFEKVKLDEDDGIYVYEVEFRSGRTEYEAEISATDGRVVEWDFDFDD